MAKTPMKDHAKKSVMIGLGLDSDGHKRVTTGKNFAMVGGTENTHDEMVEKAIKINEKLKKRGKELETVGASEFEEIANEVGLKPSPPSHRQN